MKFAETDVKLMQLIQRRGLGKASIRKYNVVFREVYELVGRTPSQLIAEAKKEEQQFNNEEGIPQVLGLSERKVNVKISFIVFSIGSSMCNFCTN
ncbi:MAG: hypothetical protein LBM96_08610 [Methanobrevibacter sp.]|jgi:hypothetical protein|nr:hypothetical protein [Candidatus Methanoflexus mossambicus]